jgi:hypothetical protein
MTEFMFLTFAAGSLCVPVRKTLPSCSASAVQELIFSFALDAVASALVLGWFLTVEFISCL